MSFKKDDLLRSYLDGDLDESGRVALSSIETGDESVRDERARMEALHALLLDMGDEQVETPPGLEGAVMQRLQSEPLPQLPWWRALFGGLVASPLRVATAGAVFMAVGLFIGLGLGGLRAGPQVSELGPQPDVLAEAEERPTEAEGSVGDPESMVSVHFVLRAPDAREVSVVGDFNGWSPRANRLERHGEVFRAVVPLPRGRHEYQFVVDGEIWLVDPAAEGTVDDGFGGRNGVLEV